MSLFGTDGIRDRAGQGLLAPAFVTRVGAAVARLLDDDPGSFRTEIPAAFKRLRTAPSARGRGRVLIGGDTRASGPAIERALVQGLQSRGVGAIHVGVITTPGVAYLTRAWGCALGVVISASHNPASDNGIKLLSPQGFKVPDAAEREIEKILEGIDGPAKRGPVPKDFSKRTGGYLDFLSRFSRPLKGLKIVVDCAHGASSAFAPTLFKRLGARVVATCASPDGRNINAGCGALHPEKLAAAVRREKADAGVAFDGDADRAILVDEHGAIRDGDHVLALCATHLKAKGALARNTVVSTVMANFGLERFLADRGIAFTRTAVGDKFVAEEMLRTGAMLGGEQSGHILFFDASTAGDGLLTALRVFDIKSERGAPLSELTKDLKKFPQLLINVPVSKKPPLDRVAGIQKAIRAANRALRADGRLVVRYSGTESLCRVMVEAADGALVERTARGVADAVRKALA